MSKLKYKTSHFISPNFTHEKLQPPFYKDLVDVLEDRMINWLIEPSKELLKLKHGDIPAVALATSYFEAIESYISEVDSKNRSKEVFTQGFLRVFEAKDDAKFIQMQVAHSLYTLLRCGFAHEAMPRHRVVFSSLRDEAFLITWPKKNGEFDRSAPLESAIVNPGRYVASIEAHFRTYINQLRKGDDPLLKEKFRAAVDLKWELASPEPLVALTESQFYHGSI